MSNATEPNYDKIGGFKICTNENNAKTLNNDRPKKVEDKIDIIAREK